MKFILTVLIIFSSAFSSQIELDDKAYRAYKKGDYTTAFKLYQKSPTVKSDYNLAQFYEKGIGTKKDPQKAKEYYQMVYNSIDFRNFKTCENPMLPYFYITLKKLHKTTEYKALKRLCSSEKDPFLKRCPAAKVIPKFDRADMDQFSCILYKKFPNSMKKLLHLHTKILSYGNVYEPVLVKKYRSRLLQSIRPIMHYYIKSGTRCISQARINRDITKCFAPYESFLRSALISREVSVFLDVNDKKLMQQEREESQRYEKYLKQAATKKEKAKAIQELKKLHKNIQYEYFR